MVKLCLFGTLALLLSGCVKFDLDLTVNNDSTVSGTMIFAVSEALDELGGDEESDDPSSDLIDPASEGVTVEDYDQDGFIGQKLILDRVPFNSFSEGGDSGDLTITREGDLITLNGYLDLAMDSGEGTSTSEEQFGEIFGDAFVKSLFASADLKIRITFPAEIISTTGELSSDKRSVTWTPEIGEKLDLTTTVKIPSINYILYGGVGLVIITLLGLVIARSKKKKVVQVDDLENLNDSINNDQNL
jgi:hypothetical protein